MSAVSPAYQQCPAGNRRYFYARIYTRYLSLLRASVWKDNIENKIHVIQRSYTLLNEEVSMYRFELLGLFAMGLLGLILLTNLYIAFK